MTSSFVYITKTAEGRRNEDKWRGTIEHAEIVHGIPAGILHRLLATESRFRDDIITGAKRSPAGAVGIAQFMPATAREMAIDPYNVPQAINGAARYLAAMYAKFGDWRLAVAAYNAGPGNVAKYNGVPPFRETRAYVAQIVDGAPIV